MLKNNLQYRVRRH